MAVKVIGLVLTSFVLLLRNANGLPQVQTSSGLAVGATVDVAHVFYEIPYAKPPVGSLRFKDPEAVEDAGTIDASVNDYIVCYQDVKSCSAGSCYTNLTEDCLVLNVFVPLGVDISDPAAPPSDRLPVMFFIHGGGNTAGSGTEQLHNGQWLSNVTNSIVVTINYRLGVFGFFRYPAGGFSGNQGLKDQQLAMTWVQQNIQSFGGDKNKVTIFGQIAGAQAILIHLVSTVSKPLFQRAILESCPHVFYPTANETLTTTGYILGLLNCTLDVTQCLLDTAPATLVAIRLPLQAALASSQPFLPYIDGVEIRDQPINMFRDGLWHTEKEVLLGTTLEEISSSAISQLGAINSQAFMAYNVATFGNETAAAVLQKYGPLLQNDDYGALLGKEMTHFMFNCPTRATARFASASSTQKNVFLYTSAYAPTGSYCEAVYEPDTLCGTSYHTSELPVVFRSGPSFGYIFNNNDRAVADEFSTYWGSFARTGDPSNGLEVSLRAVSNWPKYIEESWANIQIQAPSEEVVDDYLEDICDFWDSVDYYVIMPDNAGQKSSVSMLLWLMLALLSGWFKLCQL